MREHNVASDVERIAKSVFEKQSISFFRHFHGSYVYRKVQYNLRLMASVYKFPDSGEAADDVIVVFHTVLKKDGRMYRDLVADADKFTSTHFEKERNGDSLLEWLKVERKRNAPPEKPRLSSDEHDYVWKAAYDIESGYGLIQSQLFIYESDRWIRNYIQNKDRFGYETIRSALVRFRNHLDIDRIGLIPVGENNHIAVRMFPGYMILYLFDIYETSDRDSIISMIGAEEDMATIFGDPLDKIQEDLIYRNSYRSYPEYILFDDRWSDIQESDSSNLALSPEERMVMTETFDYTREHGFPLFLSGRAGSGKSTLLHYLFSEYVFMFHQNSDKGLPVPQYLSYSPQLVQIARKTVREILRLGHRFEDDETMMLERIETEKGRMFTTFSDFLRGMLPPDAEKRFRHENYISYPSFISKFNGRFGRDPGLIVRLNVDLCWHVIRTFIKGYDSEEYLDPEDYEQMGKSSKTVTPAVYRDIYDKVWIPWYKPLTSEDNSPFWDDLDLSRHIIEKGFSKPHLLTVFCDEAQDFTRLELDLIYRSTVFSDRRLSIDELKRAPICFAGDQFQTLNPTGFKWSNLRTSYADKFIEALVPWEKNSMQLLHFRELIYNYRSSPPIVRFCNSVQVVRAGLFRVEASRQRLQEPWKRDARKTGGRNQETQGETTFLGPALIIADNRAGEYIKGNSNVRIIAPCNLDEERTYFSGTPFLLDFAPQEDGFPLTVESAMRAKGQEYDEVIVYGFGKFYAEKGYPSLESIREGSHEPETLLEIEYFFNKLYVAVSRAKKRLFIMDTPAGREAMWKHFLDEDMLGGLSAYDPSEFSRLCCTLRELDPSEMHLEDIDPVKSANQKEEEGRKKLDPFLLTQASGLYLSIGDGNKANRCKAFACEISEDFNTAGDHYLKCQDFQGAFKCYWKAREYGRVIEVADKSDSLRYSLKTKFARLHQNKDQQDFINLSATLLESEEEKGMMDEYFNDLQFAELLEISIDNFVNNLLITEAKWRQIYTQYRKLCDRRILEGSSKLGVAALRAGFYSEAVTLFEKYGDNSSSHYQKARELQIMDAYEKDPNSISDLSSKKLLIEQLVNSRRDPDVAAKIMYEVHGHDKHRYSEYSKLFNDNLDEDKKKKVAHYYLKSMHAIGEYEKILEHIGFIPRNTTKLMNDAMYRFISSNPKYWHGDLTLILAESDHLQSQTAECRKTVSSFLNKCFLSNSLDADYGIDPLAVGAAFEKVGRPADAHAYFGKVLDRGKVGRSLTTALVERDASVLRELASSAATEDEKKAYAILLELRLSQADRFNRQFEENGSRKQVHNETESIDVMRPEMKNEVLKKSEATDQSMPLSKSARLIMDDMEVIADRKNMKFILRNNATNTDIIYNPARNTWRDSSDELSLKKDAYGSILVEEWNIRLSLSDTGVICVGLVEYGIDVVISGLTVPGT